MPATATKRPEQEVDEDEEESLFSVPTVLEPETYMVKCLGLRKQIWEGENKFNPGKENASIMWDLSFARVSEEGVTPVKDENTNEPYHNEFPTTLSMSPKSKAYKYATAFLRRGPTKEEVKKLSKVLFGKKAMAIVGQKDNGYPEIVDMFPYLGK